MTELTTTESEHRHIPFKKIIISLCVVLTVIFTVIAVLSSIYPAQSQAITHTLHEGFSSKSFWTAAGVGWGYLPKWWMGL